MFIEPFNFSFFSITGQGIDLDYCDIGWFALEIREGNGTPLQCSCLENPRDREPGGLPSMGSHTVGHD